MNRLFKTIGIILFFSPIFSSPCFSEELKITTYYPSPYVTYNQLQTYSNTYLATSSGNVGIGTTSPSAKLQVNGSTILSSLTVPGATYLATTSGNVGIGQASASYALDVNGIINAQHYYEDGTEVIFLKALNPTPSYIPKFTSDPEVLENSYISQSGISINVAATLYASDVCITGTSQCLSNPLKISRKWYRDQSNGTSLGSWDYCALSQVEGMDDNGDEGAGVHASSAGTSRPIWTAYRGHDVDHYEIFCMKIDINS